MAVPDWSDGYDWYDAYDRYDLLLIWSALCAIIRSMPSRRSAAAPSRSVERAIVVDGRTIRVRRKAIKNLYLRVQPADMSIVVSAPWHMSLGTVAAFAREHRDWIEQQEQKLRDRGSADRPQWTDRLKAQAAAALEAQLPDLLAHWESTIGRSPSHITLRAMTSRWGSCTPRTARIRLNLQLGMMDRRLLEYVLVHEMTHLWVPGHGPEFRRHMDRYLPQWRTLRMELNRQPVWRG